MGGVARFLLYGGSLATYVYTVYYFIVHVKGHSKRESTFAGEWKYLTILNLWLQMIYYTLCVFGELLWCCLKPSSPVARSVRSFIDGVHTCAAWPYGVVVAVLFWAIYAVDRELVYPKSLDEYIPLWVNHVMHTVHVPLLLADKYTVSHRHLSHKVGASIALGLGILYQTWVLYLALYRDIWVYPILNVMNWPLRIIFFLTMWIVVVGVYRTGHAVSMRFWGNANVVIGSKVKFR